MLSSQDVDRPSRVRATPIFRPTALGSIQGTVRQLTAEEANDLRFVSHDKILTWEGIVDRMGQPNAMIHLIDTDRFQGHFGYVQQALGRGSAYTQDNFFGEIQFPERRRYMPFLVFDFRQQPLIFQGKSYRWVMNIRRYNYQDSHPQLADMLVNLKNLLSAQLIGELGEPLLFVYDTPNSFRRPHVDRLQEVKAAGFEVITEQAMIEKVGGSLVSVLNPGTAIGHLRLIKIGESIEGLTPRHIAVFEDTPDRIPPVSGIVTLEPQTPLSHVNLLAKNRGTPNVSTAKIDLIPNLEQSLGSLVRMVAKPEGLVQFQPTTQVEAERFWQSRVQTDLEVAQITATSLLPIEFAIASNLDLALPNIGSKANHYATIQKMLGAQFVQPGFALSFAHYQKIVAEPATQALIQVLLSQRNVLSPEQINDQLQLIRDSIATQTSDATLTESIAAIRAVMAQLPTVKRIRLRSSTNSEDLPTFNGAGLYESAGFDGADSDKKLRKKLLQVMASLWLERAFWERELFGIQHQVVGMAILMNPAFSDEYANGVVLGSQEASGFTTSVNAQKGEASVTNPLDGELSETFTVVGDRLNTLQVQSRSNLGPVFLEDGTDQARSGLSPQLQQLLRITQKLHNHFVERQRVLGDQRRYGIDLEYKLMQKGNEVVLYIKQSRLLNLDPVVVEAPTAVLTQVVAKDNGMGGAHLRRQPKQLAQLKRDEFCVIQVHEVVGANTVEAVGNGFLKLNVVVPSRFCPGFTGTVYVFARHFNVVPSLSTLRHSAAQSP